MQSECSQGSEGPFERLAALQTVSSLIIKRLSMDTETFTLGSPNYLDGCENMFFQKYTVIEIFATCKSAH